MKINQRTIGWGILLRGDALYIVEVAAHVT